MTDVSAITKAEEAIKAAIAKLETWAHHIAASAKADLEAALGHTAAAKGTGANYAGASPEELTGIKPAVPSTPLPLGAAGAAAQVEPPVQTDPVTGAVLPVTTPDGTLLPNPDAETGAALTEEQKASAAMEANAETENKAT